MSAAPAPPAEFALQPTLLGELLELRPLKPADFEALHSAASDPMIWEQHPDSARYRRDVFRNYFDSAIESGGAFAIVERRSNRIVGSSRYYHYYPDRSEIEIGYTFLTREFWETSHGPRQSLAQSAGQNPGQGPGQLHGYNRELKRLMLDHAFKFVGTVAFFAGEHNLRSRKALEKLGAREFARVENRQPDGKLRVSVGYRILREEWTQSSRFSNESERRATSRS